MKDVNGVSEEDLNKSLLGLDNYFFLINDTNYELNQHFNPNYESLFDSESFLDNYNFKNELFSKDFKYYYFIVPDKSVVCKEFLPFESNYLKRNIDLIDGIIDFTDYLDTDDYFKYDSHINYQGGKKLTFKFLNYIDNKFTIGEYNKLIDDADRIDHLRYYDLIVQRNWSYSEEFRNEFPVTKTYSLPKSKGLKSVEDFPEVFKMCGSRESFYYKNEDSFSDLRVLIFGDSTFDLYGFYMSLYFKELFFYWDHGQFNIDLIRWFNPDLILEIRIERFIENLPVPDWILNKENIDLSREYLMNRLFEENRNLNNNLKKVKTKNRSLNNNLKKVKIKNQNLKLKLKELNNENHDINVQLKKVNGKNRKLNKQNQELKSKLKKVNDEKASYLKLNNDKDELINEILNSNSWKITKPLRKFKNLK